MAYWQLINENIFESQYDVVYIGIGCGLEYHPNINNNNNQQCPCFLNKFQNKLLLLFDPLLEKPLKVESLFEDKLYTIYDNEYRILKNSNTTIFAVNKPIYYDIDNIYSDEKIKAEAENNIPAIYNIISLCLSNKIKLVLQDYTGHNSQNFYISLFGLFDREELLNNILFDVTEGESGCYIELHKDQIKIIDNKIIQEKYMKLVDMENVNKHIKSRIDNIRYPLAWCYVQYSQNQDFKMFGYDKLIFLCVVYNIEIIENKNRIYILGKLYEVIKAILEDIVTVKKESIEYSHYLLTEVIYNRTQFNNSLMELYNK
jgi:hypothetical protein